MTLIKGSIPRLLKHNAYDLMMFGWMDAFRMNFPTVTLEAALKLFAERHNLSPDEFNIESAKKIYQRMNSDLKEYDKAK